MVHLKATITFDKMNNEKELETFQSIAFSYSLLCAMSEMKSIVFEQVDCGDNVEIRIDEDLDFTNWDKFAENTEMMSKFTNK